MKSRIITGIFCVVAIVICFASLGHAQSLAGAGSGQQAPTSNTYVMQEHPQHASQHDMATEQSLYNSGSVTTAHGERPLWEFGSDKVERPLGDIAREYRTGAIYTNRKKAVITLEK
jgi:hypothetical protein